MTREEAIKLLSEKLTKRIATIAPPGLGHLDETWEAVGPASADYMVAMTEWVRTGEDKARQRLEDAYMAVVQAWTDVSEKHTTRVD